MKVVINSCFGGFSLSHKAVMEYATLKKLKLYPEIDNRQKEIYGEKATFDNPRVLVHYYKVKPEKYHKYCEKWLKEDGDYRRINAKDWYFSGGDIPRNDFDLIKVIEKLRDKANGRCAKLKIVEIPDGVEYVIQEYDGNEHIAEKHRTWR
jgi:hypothetical protein